MKRFLAATALILTVLFSPPGAAAAQSPEKPQAPDVNALGAVLMDYKTGRVLWEKNSEKPMAMASTTKIMTALLALESGKLGQVTTVSERAANAPRVKLGLSKGETLTVGDLLYPLMLESANDSAVAVAEAVSGSVEDFCAAMTRRAKELGARDTVFETPNGLDLGDHHSTAYDMAMITRYALSVPAFMELVNTESAEIKSSLRTYTLNNFNRLLNEYEGADGVKTGFTGKAGHCFVGAAKRGDMQLISVVLASGWGADGKRNKWADTKEILDYGFDNYSYKTLVDAGATAGAVSIERSKTPGVDYAFNESYALPVRQDELSTLKIRLRAPQSLRAPVQKGDILGQADIFLSGRFCKSIHLVSEASAERHDLKTSLEKVAGAWLKNGSKADLKVLLPDF